MRIIGIDPGYERCGFAVLEKTSQSVHLLGCGIIKTSAQKNFSVRQREIADDFEVLLERYQPKICSIEDLFFVQNITTGLKVAQIRGILIYLAEKFGCQILEPKPTEVKKNFCGNGAADKIAIKQMAKLIFRFEKDLKIDDAADAIAIGYFGIQNF